MKNAKKNVLPIPLATSSIVSARSDVAEEEGAALSDLADGHHHAPEQTDRVRDDRQERESDDQRPDARDDELLDRTRRQHAQGVDLLGHRHRADLGGDPRADPPGNDERRQDRTQLAHDRQREQVPDEGRSAVRRKRVGGLHREHHPGEQQRDVGDREGLHAQVLELVDPERALEGTPEPLPKGVSGEQHQPTQLGEPQIEAVPSS